MDFLLNIIATEHLVADYKLGLQGLNLEAGRSGKKFSDLTPAEQDKVLAVCEKRHTAQGWAISPKKFFSLLARQTLEGYYADPGNGGNRGAASWRMVGFEVRN